jgi:hypothetical protein
MNKTASLAFATIIALATVTLSAHLITFKGTVLAVEKESIKMIAVDPETKKTSEKKFIVDEETKVLRDDKVVKWADAKIQKGEAITLTVDHDLDEELAQIIRLGVSK